MVRRIVALHVAIVSRIVIGMWHYVWITQRDRTSASKIMGAKKVNVEKSVNFDRFAVYVPDKAQSKIPTLYYLSGLTCTDENCSQKGTAGFQSAVEYIQPLFSSRIPLILIANTPGFLMCWSL